MQNTQKTNKMKNKTSKSTSVVKNNSSKKLKNNTVCEPNNNESSNTVSPLVSRTGVSSSGVERTNHKCSDSNNNTSSNNQNNSSSNINDSTITSSTSTSTTNTKNNNTNSSQNNSSTNKKSRKSSTTSSSSNSTIISINENLSSSSIRSSNKNKKSNFLRNSLFSIVLSFFIAVAFVSSNPKILSSIQKRTSLHSTSNSNTRYIRSVNSNNNNNNILSSNQDDNSFIIKLTNGVTEIYNQHLSPLALQNKINYLLGNSNNNENNMRQADLSNLSKNGKLHYIPSSAFDPTKTAHHVLEGAGYRLNIPSYVQTIPTSSNDNNNNNNNESLNNENSQNSIQSNSNSIQSNPSINQNNQFKNDDFDMAISQKQVMRPGPRFASQNNNVEQPLKSNNNIISSNETPLSKVDPVLDNLIKEMLEKRSLNLKQNNLGMGNNFNLIKQKNTSEIFNKNSEEGICTASKDIVFAKTHKTGGTTITNMLLRHAEKQKLNVALPVEYHWELAGYPGTYNKELITPKQDNYNVMCHHMRFNKTEIEKQVNPLADYFTILRDPVSNFESSFGFFKDYPFTNWLDNSRSIDDFVNNAEKYYNKDTPWYFRAKNYMSFDLGFNHENNTESYIRHAINKMEEDFKFVMITDRYEESMILLKNMLCLDYDDIVYLPLKVRTDNDRKKISADTAAKIKKWNRLDTAIYEYFSQRFEQMTIDYGKEKLANEVQILKEKLKDVEARCVEDYDSQSLKPWIKRIKLRKPSGQKCQRLVWGEVKYADYLRQTQYSTLSEEEYNNQPKLDDKIQLMQEIQKQVLGDTTI